MLDQIVTAFQRSRATLLQDAAGVASLVVLLMVVLHLPGF